MSSAKCLCGAALLVIAACAPLTIMEFPVDSASSHPGESVTLNGEPKQLVGVPLEIGSAFPATSLVDAYTSQQVDISRMRGKVLLLSVVPSLENVTRMKFSATRQPSLDNRLYDAQTLYLGRQGRALDGSVVRIVISRDLPVEQMRFAGETELKELTCLSDFRDGGFGRATGLLVKDLRYLARAVILIDRDGIVRYMQVVPELTHLPDMEIAFAKARELAQ